MEAILLAEHQQQLEVVERARGRAALPSAADVDHQAAVFFKDAPKTGCERPEPIAVAVCVFVAVGLLAHEPEGRRCHHQVHRLRRRMVQVAESIAAEHGAERRSVVGTHIAWRVFLRQCARRGIASCVFPMQVEEVFAHRTES